MPERSPTVIRSGRREVSGRTRLNRVTSIESFIELVRAGNQEPTLDDVAAKASLSRRSLSRYFGSLSGLIAAVAEHMAVEFAPLLADELDPDGTLDERIDRFVERRLDIYEQTGFLARAARAHHAVDPAVQQAFEETRRTTRTQLRIQFAAELDTLKAGDRDLVTVAMHIPFLFEGIEYANRTLGNDRSRVTAMLRDHLRRVLEPLADSKP